jgi:hypothetical protein
MSQSDSAPAESPVHIWNEHPGLSESKLFHEYLNRLVAGRDMHVIITAASETGVGKTTLAFILATMWDQHGWGVHKATLDPKEYQLMYDEVEPGSVLLLDEVERAVDARRGGSKDNVGLSQSFASKRYRQVFGMMTAPSKGWVDKRIGGDAADYWIQAEETDTGRPKGEATVYRLRNNEHYEQDYTKKTETITWTPQEWNAEFRRLDRKKVDELSGSSRTELMYKDEVEELLEEERERVRTETENEMMYRAYEHFDLNQSDVGVIAGLSQQQVSNRLDEYNPE